MKIVITKATVSAVKPLMETIDGAQIPSTALVLKGQVPPDTLDEFAARLKPALFENDIPAIPQLGKIEWLPEYEHANFTIDGLKFTDAEMSEVVLTALPGYLVELKCKVTVTNPSEEMRGKLNGLLAHEVKVRLEKMTQKVLDADDDDEDKDDAQLSLGTDGKPIKPLMQPETAATKH